MQSVTTDIVQNVEKIENTATAWQVAPTDADRRDKVMVALADGYVVNLERAAFRDDMRFHERECKAHYRNAYNVEMVLGQAAACGVKWGI
jgi:hypothetical protein